MEGGLDGASDGLEPAASGVTGRRSNQLSYARNPKSALGRSADKRAVTAHRLSETRFPVKGSRRFSPRRCDSVCRLAEFERLSSLCDSPLSSLSKVEMDASRRTSREADAPKLCKKSTAKCGNWRDIILHSLSVC